MGGGGWAGGGGRLLSLSFFLTAHKSHSEKLLQWGTNTILKDLPLWMCNHSPSLSYYQKMILTTWMYDQCRYTSACTVYVRRLTNAPCTILWICQTLYRAQVSYSILIQDSLSPLFITTTWYIALSRQNSVKVSSTIPLAYQIESYLLFSLRIPISFIK